MKVKLKRETGTQFKGCYFVGVFARDQDESGGKKTPSGKLITADKEFECVVRNGKEFQSGSLWLDIDVIPRKKVQEMDLVLDKRDWVREISAAVSNQDVNHADQDNEEGMIEHYFGLPNRAPISRNTGPSASLRPPQDVIVRIKWDPQLIVTDFLIGYEDRIVGIKETDLGKWNSEQADEEFIPMHLIVGVRRKGEHGEKVWDRKNNIDLIIGSGKGSGK